MTDKQLKTICAALATILVSLFLAISSVQSANQSLLTNEDTANDFNADSITASLNHHHHKVHHRTRRAAKV